jgi:cysteinyl-tRNA synthetase
MVNFIGDKMSKSVGNILDAREAVELHGRNAVRMWFLQSHYSQPIDYSGEILEEKKRSFMRLNNLYGRISDSSSSAEIAERLASELKERFDSAMRDDFNTPEVVAALSETAERAWQEINTRPKSAQNFAVLRDAMNEVMGILGFDDLASEEEDEVEGVRVRRVIDVDLDQTLNVKVLERDKARKARDWAKADRLRKEIEEAGWLIEDTSFGYRIHPKG